MLVAFLAAAALGPAPVAAPPAAGAPPARARRHAPRPGGDVRPGGGDPPVDPLSVLGSPQVLAALGPLVPKVGAWAEYRVRTRGKGDLRLKLSILPPALDGGRYWLELDSASEESGPIAMKLLVRGDPRRPQDVERAILSARGQMPLEVPLEDLQQPADAGAPPAKPPALARIRKLPPADVRTPAGLFPAAERLAIADTRIWRSSNVPFWGLVRSRSPRQTVECIGYALAGAHSLAPQGTGSESTK